MNIESTSILTNVTDSAFFERSDSEIRNQSLAGLAAVLFLAGATFTGFAIWKYGAIGFTGLLIPASTALAMHLYSRHMKRGPKKGYAVNAEEIFCHDGTGTPIRLGFGELDSIGSVIDADGTTVKLTLYPKTGEHRAIDNLAPEDLAGIARWIQDSASPSVTRRTVWESRATTTAIRRGRMITFFIWMCVPEIILLVAGIPKTNGRLEFAMVAILLWGLCFPISESDRARPNYTGKISATRWLGFAAGYALSIAAHTAYKAGWLMN